MINSWKNNLLNLPDSIFFDIMRNYLGDLKTPFNKHDLVRSLTTVISNKNIRNRIFSFIDFDDSRLLTAVALLEAADIDELYEFTKRYYSFLELHNRIANLQERLLVCVDYPVQNTHQGKKLITLNPIFEEELKSTYLNTSAIFSSMSIDREASRPWLNEQLIAAFLSFTSANKNFLKTGGISRKKAETRFAEIFLALSNTSETSPVNFLVKVIITLGFISENETGLRINTEKIIEFGNFPPQQRNIILSAAAVSAYSNGRWILNTAVRIMSLLFNSLNTGSRLHENELKSFIFLMKRNVKISNPEPGELTVDLLTDALSYCGFLVKDDDFRIINFPPDTETEEKLRIQSNFEISAPAGFPLAEEILAALCCEIRSYDIIRTYELTKQSFSSAMDSGLKADNIISSMKNSSTGSIPQNILFSMSAWEKEYNSILLNYGIVMTVSNERLPLIEHSPKLKQFFTASPAPGVFILDPAREDEWRKAFAEAGFDMLPRTASILKNSTLTETEQPVSISFDMNLDQKDIVQTFNSNFTPGTDKLIDEINGKIRKLSISAENKQKLEARALKKLILADSQLIISNKPEERGEAGGIDHRAKIRLVERALELDNLLEVTTAKDLDLEKRLIKPFKLIKTDTGNPAKPPVFLIEGIELPEETELQIPITRISYLRMLKSSLFTP